MAVGFVGAVKHTMLRIGTRAPVALACISLLSPWASGVPSAETSHANEASAIRSAMIVRRPEQALLLDAKYAGRDTMVAVGEQGVVAVSADYGANWRQAVVPFDATITRVFFVDNEYGWAVGHEGAILHSKDGGASWELQRADSESGGALLDVLFFDRTRGVAIGVNSLLLVTNNGGVTWSAGPVLQDDDGFEINLYAVASLADRTLLIAGESGYIFRSTDHGSSWSRSRLPYVGSMFGIIIAPIGPIVFGLLGHAFVSSDGGLSWAPLTTGVEESLLGGAVTGANDVILVGLGGAVSFSRDGGSTYVPAPGVVRRPFTAVLPLASDLKDGILLFGGGGPLKLKLSN